jgi:hypothetical protein
MKIEIKRLIVSAVIVMTLLVARSVLSNQDINDYDYYGSPITDMSGMSCMPVTTNSDEGFTNNEIVRSITGGLFVTSSWTGSALSYTCPLSRRNSTPYGETVQLGIDRILMTSLRVSVWDGKSTDWVGCSATVATGTGSFYSSSWRYACATSGGCTTQPAASFTGGTEIFWTNPFGSTEIKNVGAANVTYTCVVPGNSHIYWAEATYSPNN